MIRRLETRTLRAEFVFDAEDAYARGERVLGAHPRPIGALAYRIVARRVNGEPQPLVRPPLLDVVRNPSGYDLCYGFHRTPRSGLRRLALTPGDYLLRVDSDHYHPATVDLTVPGAGAVVGVDLWPGPVYPFPAAAPPGGRRQVLLRGVVRSGPDGRLLPDVTVSVAAWGRTVVTGETGQWVIPGPPDARSVDVTATTPGGAVQTHPAVAVRTDRDSTTVPDFRF